jgi:LPXTG-motif cell wall-anchored protein
MKKLLAIVLATALVLSLFAVNSFAETKWHVSRDQLTVDGADRASFGGNPETTSVDLTGDVGKELRVWGWVSCSDPIEALGYRINGGDIVYSETFFAETGSDVIGAGASIAGETGTTTRMAIMVPITEGGYDVEAIAKTAEEEHVIWIVKVNGGKADESGAATFSDVAILDNGGGAIGTWVDKKNTSTYIEFTTAGAFKAITLGQYWASNPDTKTGPKADWSIELYEFAYNVENTLAQAPVKSMTVTTDGDLGVGAVVSLDLGDGMAAGTYVLKFVLTNSEYTEEFDGAAKNPYFVLPKIDNPNADNFKYAGDGFNLVFTAEAVDGDFFVANPADTDVPATQETQPQTGDMTVAMFAVIAVLALGAVVVFSKKRAF